MKRPSLTDTSLLAAIFKPKSNPVPSGLRKRALVGKKGRSTRRLRAYNNMSALNQKLLVESGQRESYLRGEATLANAKAILRPKAERLGIVKAPRDKQIAQISSRRVTDEDAVSYAFRTLRQAKVRGGGFVNIKTIRQGVALMTNSQKTQLLGLTADGITTKSRDPTNKRTLPSGEEFNPYWYH